MSQSTSKTVIMGNSLDIHIDPCSCESEIRADIKVSHFTAIRLWGQILNALNEPVPNALVKLVKVFYTNNCPEYQGIAHTTSDCEGFYQFDICCDESAWYKVLVGKSNTGKEIIVSNQYSCDYATPPPHTPIVQPATNTQHLDPLYDSYS